MAVATDQPTVADAARRASLWDRTPRGLVTIVVALVVLFALSAILAPSSVASSTLSTMLQFAAVLAIVGLGQTLVVQQGGIDLSVPGAVSVTVVIVTHQADSQDSRLLPAMGFALVVVLIAGAINGLVIGRLGLNPIVATLGMNALLYAVVLGLSGGIPRGTTDLLYDVANSTILGIPFTVVVAIITTVIVTIAVKKTVAGRRFEAVGANPVAAWAAGLRVPRHRANAYVWAMVLYWLAGVLLAGIVKQPTAYMGDVYLLPSVAAVVLGGTSLLGGRGFMVATALSALFLEQLRQFVLALGVNFAVRTLVEAAALAVGVALYTVDWGAVRQRIFGSKRSGAGPGSGPPASANPDVATSTGAT